MRRLLRTVGWTEYGGDELLLATLACAALAWALWVGLGPPAALLALPPWLFVVWFFRDPDRRAPADPALWVAPADGTVQDIEEVDEPSFLGGRAVRVGIFLSPLDVHVNRAPCAGTVVHVRYRAGEFLPAYNAQAPERNEAVEMGLLTRDGLRVLVKQISGVVARRIVCEARLGQELPRGARYGMIKFGSRTEVYLPVWASYRVVAKMGQRVRGGETAVVEPAGAEHRV